MSRLTERIENFNKAFDIYIQAVEEYKKNPSNILAHLALVQSFEICFELSWKVLKDYLKETGIAAFTPRDVIKESFAMNIIKNGQIWIDMANDRNASSHEYNMEKINIILERISTDYYEELLLFKTQTGSF